MNEFEQRLRRVPVKPLPGDWRAEILAAAAVRPSPERGVHAASTWLAWLTHGLLASLAPRAWQRTESSVPVQISGWRSLFWPHPRAWAGLATVWVFIALLHFSQRDDSPVLAEKSAPPSPEMLADLRWQQQMLVELLGPNRAGEADRPKKAGPHTQLVRAMLG